MVLNSVMVGFFTAVTHLLDPDAVGKAVADSVPPSFRELNLKAFEKGLEYGITALTATANPADAELQDAVLAGIIFTLAPIQRSHFDEVCFGITAVVRG